MIKSGYTAEDLARLGPDALTRKRLLTEALLADATKQRKIEHPLQGMAQMAEALMGGLRMRKLDAADTIGRESADKDWGALSSLLSGGGGSSSGGQTSIPTGEAADELISTGSGPMPDMSGNDVYSGFMDTVRAGGVNNPYALAAIASTAKAESGFDPKNATRTWSDPSESGQAGRAGGIMSWRGPRYEALAAAGDLSPQGQAKFFLQEDPALIQALQSAKSVEEAQSLMNNAWKFAGYNRPGGEAARRLAAAQGFLPSFQGGGEVAAVSPDAAFDAVMPTGGGNSLSDEVAEFKGTPEYAAQFPDTAQKRFNSAFEETALAGNPVVGRQGLAQALMAGQPQTGGEQAIEKQMPRQTQVAQALMGQAGQQRSGIDPALIQALSNPYLDPQRRAIAQTLLEQQMQQNDPMRQMQLEKGRLELEALRNPRVDPLKVGQGETVLDPATGRVIFKADPKPEAKPSAVQEYEYAKMQGFPGTFQDWEASKKGGMSLQVDPATGAVTFQQGGNIKPMTEGQSKDAVFATRAEGALTELEKNAEALLSMGDTLAGSVPVVGNRLVSSEFQQAQQAGREFLQAILRKDTGAAITKEETAEYGEVYLPRPGDGPETLKQKAASRRRALEAIKAGMPPQAILAQEKALANTNAATGDAQMPDGMDPADWEFLTPEERRLFAK